MRTIHLIFILVVLHVSKILCIYFSLFVATDMKPSYTLYCHLAYEGNLSCSDIWVNFIDGLWTFRHPIPMLVGWCSLLDLLDVATLCKVKHWLDMCRLINCSGFKYIYLCKRYFMKDAEHASTCRKQIVTVYVSYVKLSIDLEILNCSWLK